MGLSEPLDERYALVAEHDVIIHRSATGLQSTKDLLALIKDRMLAEKAYGTALLRQGQSAAGLLERGTCRMGLFAFKSKTESLGRRHLDLAQHHSADCVAVEYLRDKLAASHKALVASGAGAVRDAKASMAALQRAKSRYQKVTRELDSLALDGAVLEALCLSEAASPSSTTSAAAVTAVLDKGGGGAGASAAVSAAAARGVPTLLRDLQVASAAYTSELAHHHEALRSLSVSLPKLLADFERLELMRIDSFKLALKKLLSAEEAMLTSQRPLVYAATDMVDAIDPQEVGARRVSPTEPTFEFHALELAHSLHTCTLPSPSAIALSSPLARLRCSPHSKSSQVKST